LIVFAAGLFVGGTLGVLAAALAVAAGDHHGPLSADWRDDVDVPTCSVCDQPVVEPLCIHVRRLAAAVFGTADEMRALGLDDDVIEAALAAQLIDTQEPS